MTHDTNSPADLALGRRLVRDVLEPIKRAFVGKDEIVDLLGVCLVARENLFILGPPGTAKSALVQELGRRLDGHVFDYLLTRFTEPNELFGPFDIRRLREGELVTNTDGMLPEADFVFLDELLNANSAILNSLLLALNERMFRRGRETRPLPMLMAVGASNRLPEDDALAALFDRFLLRVHCDNVAQEEMADVLAAGWKLDGEGRERVATVHVEEIRRLAELIRQVDLLPIRGTFVELVHRLLAGWAVDTALRVCRDPIECVAIGGSCWWLGRLEVGPIVGRLGTECDVGLAGGVARVRRDVTTAGRPDLTGDLNQTFDNLNESYRHQPELLSATSERFANCLSEVAQACPPLRKKCDELQIYLEEFNDSFQAWTENPPPGWRDDGPEEFPFS